MVTVPLSAAGHAMAIECGALTGIPTVLDSCELADARVTVVSVITVPASNTTHSPEGAQMVLSSSALIV